jgi:hypothetical protein
MLQKIVMVYLDEMNTGSDLTKADLRKMFWIYAGLAALFNVPALANPFKINNLQNVQRVEVEQSMIDNMGDIIEFIILKTFI